MIRLNHIHLSYGDKILLKDGSMEAKQGEMILIKGKSGCGKTSLLYKIGLIGSTDFEYIWHDEHIEQLSEQQKAAIRKHRIGHVMQNRLFNKNMKVVEYIQYYARLNSIYLADQDVIDLLDQLHIAYLKNQKLSSLSGGEFQRVAVTCAIAKGPELLLMDEPTSDLDENSQVKLMTWLKNVCLSKNICMIMTSHRKLESYVNKVYQFNGQKLELIKDEQHQEHINQSAMPNDHFFDYFYYQLKTDVLHYLKLFFIIMALPVLMMIVSTVITSYFDQQINLYEETLHKAIYNDDYHQTTVTVNDDLEVILMFYEPQDQIERYLQQNFHTDSCYLSQSMIRYFQKDVRDEIIHIDYQEKSLDIKVSGVFYQMPLFNRVLEDEQYIVVPIDDYVTLTRQQPSYYVDHAEQMIHISAQNYVYTSDIETINAYLETLDYQYMISQILSVIYCVLSLLLSMVYCFYRRKEWAYLYLDGYSHKDLMIYCLVENGIILCLGALLMLWSSRVDLCMILYVILSLFSIIFIHRINFIKTMRN